MIPLRYMGDGEFRTTSRSHAARCDKDLVIGEVLRWEPISDRSPESHKHYFAVINAAWGTLPEALADEYPSPESLRKRALIKCGYCDMKKIVCRHNADALAVAALVTDMDEFALVNVSENVVTVWRAHSQAMRAMGKKQFQESKDKVLHWISNLIGADVTEKAA